MKKLLFAILFICSLTLSKAQPFYDYQPHQIVLNISDTVFNGTVIKRKASLFTMTYNLQYQYLSLNWTIQHYAYINDSTYGSYLGGLIPDKVKETIADNSVIVDVRNGSFLQPDSTGIYPAGISIGQFNFFQLASSTQPILVEDMIRNYGEMADWNSGLK